MRLPALSLTTGTRTVMVPQVGSAGFVVVKLKVAEDEPLGTVTVVWLGVIVKSQEPTGPPPPGVTGEPPPGVVGVVGPPGEAGPGAGALTFTPDGSNLRMAMPFEVCHMGAGPTSLL